MHVSNSSRYRRVCAYRFTGRQNLAHSVSQSAAICLCMTWACFQTTNALSYPLWQEHLEAVKNSNNDQSKP